MPHVHIMKNSCRCEKRHQTFKPSFGMLGQKTGSRERSSERSKLCVLPLRSCKDRLYIHGSFSNKLLFDCFNFFQRYYWKVPNVLRHFMSLPLFGHSTLQLFMLRSIRTTPMRQVVVGRHVLRASWNQLAYMLCGHPTMESAVNLLS